eukprot:s3581_g7.t1
MPAVEWRIQTEYFLLVAGLLGSILPDTTSSRETQDRWHSLQEVLRMTSNAVQNLEERSALCKVSLFLCTAWETKEGEGLPSCLPMENGQVCLKGFVPDEASDLLRLQRNAEFHLGEFDRAEGDLAALMGHCRESGNCEDLLNDMRMAQNAMAWVVDKMSSRCWSLPALCVCRTHVVSADTIFVSTDTSSCLRTPSVSADTHRVCGHSPCLRTLRV